MKLQIALPLILFTIINHAHAKLSENYQQNTTVIYQPHTIPTPQPPVAISIFVDRPSDDWQVQILQAIDRTNALRAEGGMPALRYDENLSAYAQFRAYEIEQKFSHERPNGQMYRTSMNVGRAVGENIAGGKATADDAILQFKNSPKHYATLMHANYTKIGMGVAHLPNSKHKYYWVQIFGADNTSSPATFR
ncbi:CAP domain-containing protein [Moraxella oblonga]|uniref:CAP domain-containing protein n=1 Tax=Moraxella oblonga TaxID=200413 RepID=UPI000B1050F5|nr:CAP domain-containing protein [Moraxella oblonga]